MSNMPLGIYIHIPFCACKCAYCDFLSFPADKETQEKYVSQLLEEIRQSERLSENYEAATVFFGGGTPSILEGERISEIIRQLKSQFSFRKDTEITVEANPGTVNREKLVRYREAGVNRISFGLQSADNKEAAGQNSYMGAVFGELSAGKRGRLYEHQCGSDVRAARADGGQLPKDS